jgi:two-component system response regulator BaeR
MPEQAGALILVAHHSPSSVALLRSLLEGEGYTVLCAYNGRMARQLVHQHHPTLLLLDQALTLVDGLGLCRELRSESDAPAIFITSDQLDELNKLLAFSAGADDYLLLPMHPHELLGRVRVALRYRPSRGDDAQAPLRCGPIEVRLDQRRARVADQDVTLTSLEFELLAILARHPGRVFSREDLLNRLESFLRGAPLDRTVDIHVSNLRRKLRVALGVETPIETVRGVGYRMRSEPTNGATSTATDEAPRLSEANMERVALEALDQTPIPLLVLSLDRTVLLYNRAAQRLCGWSAEEVAGQVKCYSLLGCHNPDGSLLCYDGCPMRSALLHGVNEQQARYVIMLKDGREVSVSARYHRLSPAAAPQDCVLLVLQPDNQPTGVEPHMEGNLQV